MGQNKDVRDAQVFTRWVNNILKFKKIKVNDLAEDFNGTVEEWARTYLKHYIEQVYRRSQYMIEKYAKPFEKYIEE